MKITKVLLSLIVLCLLTQSSFSQENSIWIDVTTSSINVSGDRQIIPQEYRALKIDVNKLKALLESAPLEFTQEAKNNPVVIHLPMPDGSFERFRVIESPTVEKELSDKFPGLRTWSAQGIETPSATAKIDFTKKGFHAMVLSPNGDWFIDPYSAGTIEYYISYYKRNLKGKQMFECGVHELNEQLDKTIKHKKKMRT